MRAAPVGMAPSVSLWRLDAGSAIGSRFVEIVFGFSSFWTSAERRTRFAHFVPRARCGPSMLLLIERRDHPQFRGSLQTTCYGLLRHPSRARYGIGRRVPQIAQNNPRPFDRVRRLGPRPRKSPANVAAALHQSAAQSPGAVLPLDPQFQSPARLLPHPSKCVNYYTQHIDILKHLY